MKFIHTGDWHLGQLFYEYDRSYEHLSFLTFLEGIIRDRQTDVLLISGDVFDQSNPSAASVRMFYTFLNKAVKANPEIQIVIIAGNHDSPSRLESPKPLLESSNIHIVGLVEKDGEGNIDYEKLIIQLKGNNGETEVFCLAVPFLRMGEYPVIAECSDPYAEGVSEVYKKTCELALSKKYADQSVVAMGHLFAAGAQQSSDDDQERPILGNIECVSAAAFPAGLAYVALGHIHRAQVIGGHNHIRYCGTPVPMSFTESNYRHQVLSFEINNGTLENLAPIDVPVSIPLLRIPAAHQPLHEVISLINASPDSDENLVNAPYLEVRVLLEGPEPGLRYKIENALKGKYARLAKIDIKYLQKGIEAETQELTGKKLEEIKPVEIFTRVYEAKYHGPVPEILAGLFNEVLIEASTEEEK